jgi:hypothetical protein
VSESDTSMTVPLSSATCSVSLSVSSSELETDRRLGVSSSLSDSEPSSLIGYKPGGSPLSESESLPGYKSGKSSSSSGPNIEKSIVRS